MRVSIRYLIISLNVLNLTACGMHSINNNDNYIKNNQNSTYLYPDSYESFDMPIQQTADTSTTVVPESYHLGAYRSPTSAKNQDITWIKKQKPNDYTIILGEGEKAAQVAEAMDKTPKNERMAEVKYERSGKTYYQGVYGNYGNYEEAQKALSSLPDEVKHTAAINQWSSVQQKVE